MSDQKVVEIVSPVGNTRTTGETKPKQVSASKDGVLLTITILRNI